uniref:Uncharacterized protein n=1 Tax=Palpitomonas bilix TaxID=652834 RepID=A0A7S3DFT6_9EUKA|mmetsp:Transcript_35841/g.93415  ORF Transcript_35841/g.93415 Transcript_35841/m.93415 type:complete len:123 (+) Transcript_35841:121-489(+)
MIVTLDGEEYEFLGKHFKEDGTLDMRFSVCKDYVKAGGSMSVQSPAKKSKDKDERTITHGIGSLDIHGQWLAGLRVAESSVPRPQPSPPRAALATRSLLISHFVFIQPCYHRKSVRLHDVML